MIALNPILKGLVPWTHVVGREWHAGAPKQLRKKLFENTTHLGVLGNIAVAHDFKLCKPPTHRPYIA